MQLHRVLMMFENCPLYVRDSDHTMQLEERILNPRLVPRIANAQFIGIIVRDLWNGNPSDTLDDSDLLGGNLLGRSF